MTWMILMPREVDEVKRPSPPADDVRPEALLLRKIQQALDARGEIELDDDDLTLCERYSKNYRHGFDKAFKAILAAAGRH